MQTFAYPARIREDADGRLVVSFPDIPEALTDGATYDEAFAEAADALGVALFGYVQLGKRLPVPSPLGAGQVKVQPDPTTAAKIALNLALRDSGTTVSAFARRMNCDHKEARRILKPSEPTKLPRLQEALAQFGQKMEVRFRPISTKRATAVAATRGARRGVPRSTGRSGPRVG